MGRSSLKSYSDSRDEKPIQILSPFNPNFLLISELIGNERNFDMATVLLPIIGSVSARERES